MKKTFQSKGFTLIELLVVIAIIAVITSVILVSMTSSKAKARDGKRISDVNQYQLALEQFFNKNSRYPTVDEGGLQVLVPTYMSALPKDPKGILNPTDYIKYCPVPGENSPYDYALLVSLENANHDGVDKAEYYGCNCIPDSTYCLRSN
jgi:type II secretion system protein G